MATVAGTAPALRTAASTALTVSKFCGYGMPWLMIVLSSATTGAPHASALATLAERRTWLYKDWATCAVSTPTRRSHGVAMLLR